jgi:hypothetical protein
MGLPLLIGGYQGLFIRIWAWDFGEFKYVIDIRSSPVDSECSIISFKAIKKDTSQYIYIRDRKKVTPKSGWANFFDSLRIFDISEMQSSKLSVEQKGRYTSMEYIQFEIDQPNQYRFFEYLDPMEFKGEDSASKKAYEFIKYFNREMDTHIYDVEKNDKNASTK